MEELKKKVDDMNAYARIGRIRVDDYPEVYVDGDPVYAFRDKHPSPREVNEAALDTFAACFGFEFQLADSDDSAHTLWRIHSAICRGLSKLGL